MNKQPQLYALLIGIARYHPHSGVTALKSPVQDVEEMQHLLEQNYGQSHNLQLQSLYNEQASRDNIITAILGHLGEAKAADSILLYYSGHGSYGKSNKAFQDYQPNQRDEGWVCYDSRVGATRDLVDKELAVLIHYIGRSGAQVVLISDSCHAGSLTKGKESAKWQQKFSPSTGKGRALADYLNDPVLDDLAPQLKQYYQQQKGTLVVPEAAHVLLAACRENQKAWEYYGRSIFTQCLLKVWSRTRISYWDLYKRCLVEFALQNYAVQQNPQLQTLGRFHAHQTVLTGEQLPQQVYRQIYYQAGWKMDLGAHYGLPLDLTQALIVDVFDAATASNPIGRAVIQQLGFDQSNIVYLPLENGLQELSTNRIYWGRPQRNFLEPLLVDFEGRPHFGAEDKALLETLLRQQGKASIVLCDTQQQTFVLAWKGGKQQYQLRARNRATCIGNIPLWKAPELTTLVQLLEQLQHWEYSKKLDNPNSKIPASAIALSFYALEETNNERVEQGAEKGHLTYEWNPTIQQWQAAAYGLVAKNASTDTVYYCACLIISENYGVVVAKNPVRLAVGQQVELIDANYGAFVITNEEEEQVNNYLKVIISTTPIQSIAAFEAPDLPMGNALERGRMKGAVARRSIEGDWMTKTITVEIMRGAKNA